jgi:hypothetical protein
VLYFDTMGKESNQALKQVAYYVGIFMVGVYILIGLSLIFTNVFIDLIPKNRLVYGGIVLIYAIFRLYMAFRLRKSNAAESNQIQ